MFFLLLMSYILIDASGWVISDVSFGFTGGFRSCNIRPHHPNDSVGIDLTPTPIPAAKLRIFHTKQMTAEMALFMGTTFKFKIFAIANQSLTSLMTAEAFLWNWEATLFLFSLLRWHHYSVICSIQYVVFFSLFFFPPLPETLLKI